jgi:hypothetical protein
MRDGHVGTPVWKGLELSALQAFPLLMGSQTWACGEAPPTQLLELLARWAERTLGVHLMDERAGILLAV